MGDRRRSVDHRLLLRWGGSWHCNTQRRVNPHSQPYSQAWEKGAEGGMRVLASSALCPKFGKWSHLHDRKIVPVNDFFVGTLAQDLLDAIATAATYLLDLIRIVVNQAAGNLDQLLIDYRDDIALSEFPVNILDADCQ